MNHGNIGPGEVELIRRRGRVRDPGASGIIDLRYVEILMLGAIHNGDRQRRVSAGELIGENSSTGAESERRGRVTQVQARDHGGGDPSHAEVGTHRQPAA